MTAPRVSRVGPLGDIAYDPASLGVGKEGEMSKEYIKQRGCITDWRTDGKPIETLSPGEALPCPWCGEQPTCEPWHGGGPQKRLISCASGRCNVAPSVSASTRKKAIERWNQRAPSAGLMSATRMP